MELITHHIDGEDVESESGARFDSVDPYTQTSYAEVALGGVLQEGQELLRKRLVQPVGLVEGVDLGLRVEPAAPERAGRIAGQDPEQEEVHDQHEQQAPDRAQDLQPEVRRVAAPSDLTS